MKIAVITAYSGESKEYLEQCSNSVQSQGLEVTHYLICDGAELPQSFDWPGPVIQLPTRHHDYGDTPRAVGSILAAGEDHQAICYLDADNWYLDGHLQSLLALQETTQVDVCLSSRSLFDEEDRLLGQCFEVHPNSFIDTNCYLLTDKAFYLTANWVAMPKKYHCIGDRVFWSAIRKSGLKYASTYQPTVAYRSSWPHHYKYFRRPEPKEPSETKKVIELCRDHPQIPEANIEL